MTANSVVNLVSGLWIAMTAMAVLHPLAHWMMDRPGGDALDRVLYFTIWWSLSIVPGVIAATLRALLDKRLTGMARWFGWVPAVGVPAGIFILAAAGWIVE